MIAASNSVFGKIVESGRKNTVVPVPRAGPIFLTPPCGAPCLYFCSQVAPSRRTVATSSRDSAFTTDRADAVQPAGRLVVLPFELAAGVQRREDDLERARLRLRMLVHRNPAAVVLNRDRRPVLVQRDGDVRRVAVHRLVDGVVEDLPDEMMQPGGSDAADVHARPAADGLEAFENGDVFRGVRGHGEVIVPKGREVLGASLKYGN